jgi:hypothetical protein
MRKTFLRLALLGTVAAVPAYAQTSTTAPSNTPPSATAPGRAAPGAATNDSTRPGMAVPVVPDTRSGATTPNRTSDSNAAARVDDGTRTATTPAEGANSFTEGQAKSRIEAAGFTNVSDLQKDDKGIWRGRAQRGGQQVSVALDFQGNVVPNAGR